MQIRIYLFFCNFGWRAKCEKYFHLIKKNMFSPQNHWNDCEQFRIFHPIQFESKVLNNFHLISKHFCTKNNQAIILVALSVAFAEEGTEKKTEKRYAYSTGTGYGANYGTGYGTGYNTGLGGYNNYNGYGNGLQSVNGGYNQAYNPYGKYTRAHKWIVKKLK